MHDLCPAHQMDATQLATLREEQKMYDEKTLESCRAKYPYPGPFRQILDDGLVREYVVAHCPGCGMKHTDVGDDALLGQSHFCVTCAGTRPRPRTADEQEAFDKQYFGTFERELQGTTASAKPPSTISSTATR